MSGLQQRGVLWKKVQGCSVGRLPQIRVQNSGPVDRYNARVTILPPNPRSNETRSSVASSGSGMSVLSMLALRMATQIGAAGCLRVHRALNRQDPVVDGEEAAESSTTTTTTSEGKLSKSAKRRSRRKKLRDSRRTKEGEPVAKGGEEGGEERMVESVDMRVYGLVMHEKRRAAKDFFERSLMAAFLFKCLQKVGFFDDPSSNDGKKGKCFLILF